MSEILMLITEIICFSIYLLCLCMCVCVCLCVFVCDQKPTGAVEFDLRHQCKSLDDVSLNSNNDEWPQPTIASKSNIQRFNRYGTLNLSDRRPNHSNTFERCDKIPFRAEKLLIEKKDLRCERCGYVQTICDGNNIDDKCSDKTACYLNTERLNNNFNKDKISFKSTNYKQTINGSINSLRTSTSTVIDTNAIVRRRIVYAQVLLEAFGNASNPLNSNSSRFVSVLF